MPIIPEEPVPAGFDPFVFWMEQKTKILTYGILLLVGLVAFAAYQISVQQSLARARDLLSKAAKPEDYREVILKYPRTLPAANAHLLLAGELRDVGKFDEALTVLRDFTSQYPQHPLAAGGWLSMATTIEAQGKVDEAIDAYRQVAAKYASSYAAPLALLAEAGLEKGKGKNDEARRTYENVVSQFPDSLPAQLATQSLRLLRK